MAEYDTAWTARRARREAWLARRTRRRRFAAVAALAAGLSAFAAAVGVGLGSGRARPVTVPAKRPAVAHGQRHAARRARQVHAAESTAAVPILMYHVIAPAPPGAPFPGLYVTPRQFAAQVTALARAGFRGVTLDQVWSAWRGTGRLPNHPIVLSFDNGYRSQYTRALPVLRRGGWVADENLQLQGLPPTEGGLTRREVLALLAAGWELDTQGWSHADLTALDPVQLRFQVADARARIRRLYAVRANWFCYPSGRYNPTVVAAVRAAGYLGATTVVSGWARPHEDTFTLPRLRVLAATTPSALLTQIAASQGSPVPPSSYLSAA